MSRPTGSASHILCPLNCTLIPKERNTCFESVRQELRSGNWCIVVIEAYCFIEQLPTARPHSCSGKNTEREAQTPRQTARQTDGQTEALDWIDNSRAEYSRVE